MMRCSRVPHVCYPLYSPAFLLSSGFPLSSSSPTGSVLTDPGGLGLWHWFLVLATSSVSPIQIWSQLHVACLRGWPQARRQLHISVFPFFFLLPPSFPELTRSRCGARWLERWGRKGEAGPPARQGEGRGKKGGRRLARPVVTLVPLNSHRGKALPSLGSSHQGTEQGDQKRASWSQEVEAQETVSKRGRDQAPEARGPENRLPSEVQKRRAEGTEGGTDRSPRRKEEGEREGSGPAAKEEACGWGLQAGSGGRSWFRRLSSEAGAAASPGGTGLGTSGQAGMCL